MLSMAIGAGGNHPADFLSPAFYVILIRPRWMQQKYSILIVNISVGTEIAEIAKVNATSERRDYPDRLMTSSFPL